MSNKHMVIGLVAGIGIAAAGGVAAYQFMSRQRGRRASRGAERELRHGSRELRQAHSDERAYADRRARDRSRGGPGGELLG